LTIPPAKAISSSDRAHRNPDGTFNANYFQLVPEPEGWSVAQAGGQDLYQSNGDTGFEAAAYTNGSEVVIAYAGTDTDQWQDLLTDAWVGVGGQIQVVEAALFFERVRSAFPDKTITFTGHSLGGGLAALMGVFFNRPATTFDPAPFRAAATMANALKIDLAIRAASMVPDSQLAGFVTGPEIPVEVRAIPILGWALSIMALTARPSALGRVMVPTLIRGEGQIKAIATEGEFLTNTGTRLLRVFGGDIQLLRHGSPTHGSLLGITGTSIALHAQSLLIALLGNDSLRQLTTDLPKLIPALLDENFFAYKTSVTDPSKPNLLVHLLRHTYGDDGGSFAGSVAVSKDGMLGQMVIDLQLLKASKEALGEKLTDALMRVALEHYHSAQNPTETPDWYEDDIVRTLFREEANGLVFDREAVVSDGNVSKSLAALRSAIVDSGELEYVPGFRESDRFTIGLADALEIDFTSDDKSDFVFGTAEDDQITTGRGDDVSFGRGGADELNGGEGNDDLYGGEGNDVLTGGEGVDRLYGGAGDDTYRFTAGDSIDLIYDTDGQGSVEVDGDPLSGGKKVADGYWISDDKQFGFALVENGSGGHDLIISRGQTDSIRIRDWSNNQLGIALDDAPADIDPPTFQVTGDLKPVEFVSVDSDGNVHKYYKYDNYGNVITGEAQPGFADVLFGSGDNDKLSGGDGNDAISGYAGDDNIEGGTGDDLLSGGAGQDHILGGAGDDHIFAGGTYNGQRIRGPEETPYQPPENSKIVGATWAVYPSEVVLDGETTTIDTIQSNGGDDPSDEGDIVDAGTGDDYVDGGYGDDVIDGGDGKDNLRGGAGNDAVEGGAGDDYIGGDNTRFGILIGDVSAAEHGNDVLSGGAGNAIHSGSCINARGQTIAVNNHVWRVAA